MKPTIFIGSTSEGKVFADAVEEGLIPYGNCTPWYDGIFEIAGNIQNSLVSGIREADFVVIILTADDVTTSRGENYFSPRDNLIFEAGIGFGIVNPDRTFIIPEKAVNLKIPSDLAGFTLTASFDKLGKPEDNLKSSIFQIKKKIQQMGCKSIYKMRAGHEELTAASIELILSAERNILLFGRDLSWANKYSDAIKLQISRGVEVEVFCESPSTEKSQESAKILTDLGVKVHHLDRDHGIKLTLIDHQDEKCSRFMLAFKERTNMGSTEEFLYHCEIHNARDSWVMWNTFVRLYQNITSQLVGTKL